MTSSLSPLAALQQRAPLAQSLLRGRVVEVLKDAVNAFAFRFRVVSTGGETSYGRGQAGEHVIEDVVLLQAGFGALTDPGTPPTGIVYLPEVGSRVALAWDGVRWVIVGFYTGPAVTTIDTLTDPERRTISYNPGIEQSTNRRAGVPGLELPNWAFGIEPGDALMGSGNARLKACAKGAVVGTGVHCCQIHTADGTRISRVAEVEEAMVGHRYRSAYSLGPQAAILAAAVPGAAELSAAAAVTSWAYRAAIGEATHLAELRRPYWVTQEGMVLRGQVGDGRSALLPAQTAFEVGLAHASDNYCVFRRALLRDLTPVPGTPPMVRDLDYAAFAIHDHQIDADGSFRFRFGNNARLPGVQEAVRPGTLDGHIEYNAVRNTLSVRLGPSGAPVVLLECAGAGEAGVSLKAPRVSVVAAGPVKVTAPTVAITASTIQLEGAVSITGSLSVEGAVTVTEDVLARGISSARHQHSHNDGPGITTAPRPA